MAQRYPVSDIIGDRLNQKYEILWEGSETTRLPNPSVTNRSLNLSKQHISALKLGTDLHRLIFSTNNQLFYVYQHKLEDIVAALSCTEQDIFVNGVRN